MTGEAAQTIVTYASLEDRNGIDAALDDIFFEASTTRSFASPAARAAFHERWLGRYLTHYPDDVLLALDAAGGVLGYLAGCPADASRLPLFADAGDLAAFSSECPRYPAHLHVNVRADHRGRGFGARLVGCYLDSLRRRDIPGVHVITAPTGRNLAFYRRYGFSEVATRTVAGRPLLMLGRMLEPGECGERGAQSRRLG